MLNLILERGQQRIEFVVSKLVCIRPYKCKRIFLKFVTEPIEQERPDYFAHVPCLLKNMPSIILNQKVRKCKLFFENFFCAAPNKAVFKAVTSNSIFTFATFVANEYGRSPHFFRIYPKAILATICLEMSMLKRFFYEYHS